MTDNEAVKKAQEKNVDARTQKTVENLAEGVRQRKEAKAKEKRDGKSLT